LRRFAAIFMVLFYFALGSGAIERWHNAQHAAEDARLAALAGHPTDHQDPAPIHDESNCAFHCQLHLAGMAVSWSPTLVCVSTFRTFVQASPQVIPQQRRQVLILARGPPAV